MLMIRRGRLCLPGWWLRLMGAVRGSHSQDKLASSKAHQTQHTHTQWDETRFQVSASGAQSRYFTTCSTLASWNSKRMRLAYLVAALICPNRLPRFLCRLLSHSRASPNHVTSASLHWNLKALFYGLVHEHTRDCSIKLVVCMTSPRDIFSPSLALNCSLTEEETNQL